MLYPTLAPENAPMLKAFRKLFELKAKDDFKLSGPDFWGENAYLECWMIRDGAKEDTKEDTKEDAKEGAEEEYFFDISPLDSHSEDATYTFPCKGRKMAMWAYETITPLIRNGLTPEKILEIMDIEKEGFFFAAGENSLDDEIIKRLLSGMRTYYAFGCIAVLKASH